MTSMPSVQPSLFVSSPAGQFLSGTPAQSGRSKRAIANSFWVDLAQSHPLSQLPERVGALVGIPASQVAFWSAYYGWGEGVRNEVGQSAFGSRSAEGAFDDVDCDELAYDPLEDFYERFRTRSGSRRHITAFYAEAGFASPCEADLSLYRHLIDHYPVSAADAAHAIGQDPSVFIKYAAAHGVVANQKFERIAIPLGALVHRDSRLAAIVAKFATHVYETRATPVRTLAIRLGMRWADLWAIGARFSEWSLPSPTVLDSISELFQDYPI